MLQPPDAESPAPLPPPSPPRASLPSAEAEVPRRRAGRQSTVLSLAEPLRILPRAETDASNLIDEDGVSQSPLPDARFPDHAPHAGATASATRFGAELGDSGLPTETQIAQAAGKPAQPTTAAQIAEQQKTVKNREEELKNPNVQAFLKVIAAAEGGQYNSLPGDLPGRRKKFGDYSQFPASGKRTSSGRYQIVRDTHERLAKQLGLSDFSPRTQDLMAAQLLYNPRAMPHLLKGDLDGVLPLVANTWAALPKGPGQPNAHPGQPYRRYEEVRQLFDEFRKTSQPSANRRATTPTVAALLAASLVSLYVIDARAASWTTRPIRDVQAELTTVLGCEWFPPSNPIDCDADGLAIVLEVIRDDNDGTIARMASGVVIDTEPHNPAREIKGTVRRSLACLNIFSRNGKTAAPGSQRH